MWNWEALPPWVCVSALCVEAERYGKELLCTFYKILSQVFGGYHYAPYLCTPK